MHNTPPPPTYTGDVDNPSSTTNSGVKLVPFESLKGKVNFDTLKALTFKPFQLMTMSEVQRRVLSLMPYLAGGKMQNVKSHQERSSEEGGRETVNNDVVEDAEGEERGREDLLVKAKTGTGKTIVSLTSPLR